MVAAISSTYTNSQPVYRLLMYGQNSVLPPFFKNLFFSKFHAFPKERKVNYKIQSFSGSGRTLLKAGVPNGSLLFSGISHQIHVSYQT